MILVYHNISFIKEDENTVNIINFVSQLLKLRKFKIVYLDEYNPMDKEQIVICFDDGYINLIKLVIPVLKLFKYKYEVFICEKFLLDKSNVFIQKKHLKSIINSLGRLEYHSKDHLNLTKIKGLNILEEQIKCPEYIKKYDPNGFKFFAYPYWQYNNDILKIVQNFYAGARSGNGYSNYTQWALDSIKVQKNIGENLE